MGKEEEPVARELRFPQLKVIWCLRDKATVAQEDQ